MDEGAKRRLVGAAVVIALIVIFAPMLLEESDRDGLGEPIVIPDEPAFDPSGSGGEPPPEDALTAEDLIPPLPAPEPPDGGVIESAETAEAEPVPSTETAASVEPQAESVPEPAPAGPKPVPAGVMSWVVQVASLGSADAAKQLQDRLRSKGYTAFVEQAVVNGKQYYRVRVGPEVERARADGLAARLQGETGNKPLVQRYP